jgi:drug/metabolite transporter (DMT)-like permease
MTGGKDTLRQDTLPRGTMLMAAPARPQWDRRLLLGVLLICMSGLSSSVMQGFAKLLGEHYNSVQVSWARAFGHILFMLAVFLPRRGLSLLRTRRLGRHLVRSTLLFLSNLSYFFAIGFVPIADAAAMNMASPLFVAAMAWPMLRERTNPRLLAAVVTGFIGVLVIVRPGTAVFHWAALFIMFSAVTNALYQILTRGISDTESADTSAIYSSVVGSIGILLVLPFVWKTPASLLDLALFCSLGVLGALTHYLIALALGFAPANLVTPFQYMQLIGSVGVGYVLFNTWPDRMTWIGAAIVVGAGLYIGWSQTRRRG